MTPSHRNVQPWLLIASVVGIAVACGGKTAGPTEHADREMVSATSGAMGMPCLTLEESDPTFQGFSLADVSVELNAPACGGSQVCLVNHFQGRVTCPYGQSGPNQGPEGPAGSNAAAAYSQFGCSVPGAIPGAYGFAPAAQVTATDVSVAGFGPGQVPPQIVGSGAADRTANKTVYCSCRCANVDGATDDGASYCACPSGFACTQLVTLAEAQDEGVSGAYCVLDGTQYDPAIATTLVCEASATSPAEPGYCPAQE